MSYARANIEDENIIGASKKRNNYDDIKLFGFSILILVQLSLSIFFLHFGKISLLPSSFYSYCSSNHHDICCFFSLLKVIAISIPLLFALAFKSDNYRYYDSWKSDNFTGSSTQKMPWIIVQSWYYLYHNWPLTYCKRNNF